MGIGRLVSSSSLAWPSLSRLFGCFFKTFAFWLSIFSVFIFFHFGAHAQVTNVTSNQANPVSGVPHDYIKLLDEIVSPASGSLSIRINVPLPPSTFGPALPFHIDYNSSGVAYLAPDSQTPWGFVAQEADGPMTMGGWSYGVPMLSYRRTYVTKLISDLPDRHKTCYYATDYVFRDPTGGRHSLDLMYVYPNQPDCRSSDYGIIYNYTSKLSGGDTFYSASFDDASPTEPKWIITASDGTKFTFGQDAPLGIPTGFDLPNETYRNFPMQYYLPGIQDTNGNGSSEPGLIPSDRPYPGGLCDPHGRCVSWDGMGTASATVGSTVVRTIVVPGLTIPYSVTWKRIARASGYSTPPSPVQLPNSYPCSVGSPTAGDQDVISAITLPNGRQYRFEYDTKYGLISKIIYPTGGWVSYQWGWNSQSEFAHTYFEDETGPHECAYTYSTPAIVRRTVSFDGVTPALQQDFSYSTTWVPDLWKWSSKATTVVSHDLITGQSSQVEYTYAPGVVRPSPPPAPGRRNSQVPYENVTTYKNATGETLRTVTKTWNGWEPAQVSCEATALENGLGRVTTYGYGNGGVLANKKEYDFASGATCSNPGTLIRETAIEYRAFSDTAILDRPSHVWIKDSAGTPVAQTDNSYDEHGNLLSVTKKCLKNCGSSPAASTTTYTYNVKGQVLTITSPNGNVPGATPAEHTTTYEYDSNHYPWRITYPPANGISQQRTFNYDGTNGLLMSATDVNNGVTTTYEYQDSLNRLKKIIGPGDALTTFSYNDVPYNPSTPSPSVATTKKLDSTRNSVTTVAFDGLGQPVRTLLADEGSTIYTDTAYDGHGRVWKVTNPYRTTSDSSYGVTEHQYDAIGRLTTVRRPDGSVASTSYDGDCTTVVDEANKQRRSCKDGAGRLIRVEEPGKTQ